MTRTEMRNTVYGRFPIGTRIILYRNGQLCPNAESIARDMNFTRFVNNADIESDTMHNEWRLSKPQVFTVIGLYEEWIGIENAQYQLVLYGNVKEGKDFDFYKTPAIIFNDDLFTL